VFLKELGEMRLFGADKGSDQVESAGTAVLEAREISAGYGKSNVIRNVSVKVHAGEIVTILGPNGAGKTTTVLTLSGDIPTRAGEVVFDGRSTKAALHEKARRGLGLVTEERSLFPALTAKENLRVAGAELQMALDVFPELFALLNTRVGLLSGGEQQMIAVARILARRPKVILADELSLGLAPMVVNRLLQVLKDAASHSGVGVLLVEQHVQKALALSDRTYIMRRGEIAFDGTPDELSRQPALLNSVYLATTAEEADLSIDGGSGVPAP
jgi:branched-chain amino acid transport system ATP-binding protein